MDAPKLVWKYFAGTNTEGFLYTSNWRIKAKFDWSETRSTFIAESSQDGSGGSFSTVDDAKAWCQAREDEAWAAANPVKEYSDTEILDFIDMECKVPSPKEYVGFNFGRSNYDGSIKNVRDAVSAFLRERPTPAEPASEPVPDREMTLREFEKTIEANGLIATFGYGTGNRSANVWERNKSGTKTDIFADTLSEALAKCLAAIAKHKAENPR
jgi:hypothetical protein